MIRSPCAVLIGIGNALRRDDGIGPAVAAAVNERDLPGVSVMACEGEPSQLLEAWSAVRLAVIVDAMRQDAPVAGRIHRSIVRAAGPDGRSTAEVSQTEAAWAPTGSASTHALGIWDAVRLAEALGRMPQRLVLYAVEVTDIGFGEGLSPAVAGCLPDLTQAVLAEFGAG